MSEIIEKYIFVFVRVLLAVFLLHFFSIYLVSFDYLIATSPLMATFSFSQYSSYFDLLRGFIKLTTGLGILCSVFLFIGYLVRFSSVVLWVCLFTAINANELIAQLHYPYLAITLILIALFCQEKFFSFEINFYNCKMQSGNWAIVFGKLFYLTVFVSGCSKLFVAEWRNGVLTKYLCQQFLFVDFSAAYCSSPDILFSILTYSVLLIELGSILFLLGKFRFYVWLLNIILQMGILLFIPVQNISMAMILVQLFFFDISFYNNSAFPQLFARAKKLL